MRRLIEGAVAVAIIPTVFVLGASDAQPQPAADPAPRTVRVAPVEAAPAHRPWRAHGTVRAVDHAHVSFTQPGRLIERTVDVGDAVRAGDVVARLDAEPIASQLRAAEASVAATGARLDQLRRDRARADALSARGAASVGYAEQVSTELAAIEASERAARAQLGEARRSMRETVLRAPFDGVVTAVHLEADETAGAGTPIVSLSGDGALEVEVSAPESLAAAVAVGDEAEVTFPLLDRGAVAARVERIAAAAGPDGLFRIVVALPAAGVRPGSSAVVAFRARRDGSGFSVPVSAVVAPSGDAPAVLVVRHGVVRRTPVAVGELLGDHVLVQGALRAGDRVVTAGTIGLLDGARVTVRSDR